MFLLEKKERRKQMEIYGLIGTGRFGYVYSGKLKEWNVALKFSHSNLQLEIEQNIYRYLQQVKSEEKQRHIPFFFAQSS